MQCEPLPEGIMTSGSLRVLRRAVVGAAGLTIAAHWMRVRANPPKIRIGVLTDISGRYGDSVIRASVICTKQARSDFGGSGGSIDAEVLSVDHQNNPDSRAGIAR